MAAVRWKFPNFPKLKGVMQLLLMPSLSPSMTKGTLTKLYTVSPGDEIKRYELFADIRCHSLLKTAKEEETIELELELQDDLFVVKVLSHVNSTLSVGQPIAIFCDELDDVKIASSIDFSGDNIAICMNSSLLQPVSWQAYVKSKEHSLTCG